MIAAVGSDGTRLVVWGIGDTEAEARADAQGYLDDATGSPVTLEMHTITEFEASIVRAGGVAWPISTASLLGEVQS